MSILRPCPFCGCKAEMDTKEFFDSLVEKHGKACLMAKCENPDCGARMYCHHPSTDYYEKAEILLKRWNTRGE